MTIHAIRHLRTSWNDEGLMQGLTDIELLESDALNNSLIASISDELEQVKPDLVLVSPLKRAVQTADRLGLDYSIEPLVSEMSFGRFEGLPKTQMLDEMSDSWLGDPLASDLKGEFEQLEIRIRLFLEKYEMNPIILIVSHGAFIRGLISIINSGSLTGMNERIVENGKLITMQVD
ncbi:MAG: histidine phosphatase family protein [Flavobacteriales bacterium]|jgi:probable phosphoglycerate mutase|nr:histidine phosphatase family protein [Flavobacteriales bacterium]MBT3963435.1 histidine phosphatase family protein [Flavobacteriales bacterium]MBT4704454.1 histidine phosphatase family protein [Flavobacteriales bacterium]MBT4931209.1 histidine phosphatase family protein [Flavobacteriales bacterium]MBT5132014.1 histidine phosphatase family protein [Flavobacteriales bacterium]